MKVLYETERLFIREWQSSDAEDLFEYCSNSDVIEFMPFPVYTSINDAYQRLSYVIGTYKKPLWISSDGMEKIDYAISLKQGGKVVGSIGFAKITENAGGVVEIGYMLNPSFHGKGFMTEAVRGLFRYLKGNKIAMRVEAKHDLLNEASGAVMRRAGMKFEGVHRKSCDNNKHTRADMAWYSILAEEIF